MTTLASGIDYRTVSGGLLVAYNFLTDSNGAIITSGTTSLYIYELQDNGTLTSFDFDDSTFKAATLTTETASMTHRTGNNGATNTGIWTYQVSDVSDFKVGAVYLLVVTHSSLSPSRQVRAIVWGDQP